MRTSLKSGTRKTRFAAIGLALAGLVAIPGAVASAATGGQSHGQASSAVKPTIVLEHGAWADGSSWSGVVTRLQQDGYTVDVPPNPLRQAGQRLGLPGQLPRQRARADCAGWPLLRRLRHHQRGRRRQERQGPRYVDAFIPAQGDTINGLTAQFPGSQLAPSALSFVPSPGGVTDVYVKPSQFRGILANDLSASQAAELAATQRPIAATALTEPSGPSAWTRHPQLGRDRNGRPRDPASTGIHGRPRAHHGNEDQRLAPVDDLPPGDRRHRDQAGRPRHLLAHDASERRTTSYGRVAPAFRHIDKGQAYLTVTGYQHQARLGRNPGAPRLSRRVPVLPR